MDNIQGCISSKECPECGTKFVCDSSGKAGTQEGNVYYIWGPCCCGFPECYVCQYRFVPKEPKEFIGKEIWKQY